MSKNKVNQASGEFYWKVFDKDGKMVDWWFYKGSAILQAAQIEGGYYRKAAGIPAELSVLPHLAAALEAA